MANELSHLTVSEVSLVDRPACSLTDDETGKRVPLARVAIWKRDAEDDPLVGLGANKPGMPFVSILHSIEKKAVAGVKFVIGFPKDSGGSTVQSVIFEKDKFDVARAKAWLKDHDFSGLEVDETGESFRFRQADPGKFERFRTIAPGEARKADDQQDPAAAGVDTSATAKAGAAQAAAKTDRGGEELPSGHGEKAMTLEDIEKKLTDQEAVLKALQTENDILKAENDTVLKMSKKERKLYAAMDTEKRKEFMAGDTEKRKAMLAECNKAKAEADAKAEPDEDDLEEQKKRDALITKVDDTVQRLVKSETELAEIRKRERLAVFTKRAETEFPHTSGSPEDKGTVLMEMADKFGEQSQVFKQYLETQKAADKAIAMQFTEVGKVGGGELPAIKAFDAAVDEIRKRDNVSVAKATDRVMSEHPELYMEYDRQKRQVTRQ
jgi:hypothetical protein